MTLPHNIVCHLATGRQQVCGRCEKQNKLMAENNGMENTDSGALSHEQREQLRQFKVLILHFCQERHGLQ